MRPASTILDGRTTVASAGTAVRLSTASVVCSEVLITAESDNTGVVVVGGSTVVAALATRRGIYLNAGDSMVLAVGDLNSVYLDSTVNGDGVTYCALS